MADNVVWVNTFNPQSQNIKETSSQKNAPKPSVNTNDIIKNFNPESMTAPKQPQNRKETISTPPSQIPTISQGAISSGGGGQSPQTATASPSQSKAADEAKSFFKQKFQKTFVNEKNEVVGIEDTEAQQSILYRHPTTIRTYDIDNYLNSITSQTFGQQNVKPIYQWQESKGKNIIGYTTESGEEVSFKEPKSKSEFAEYAYNKGMFSSEEEHEKFEEEFKSRKEIIEHLQQESENKLKEYVRQKNVEESLQKGLPVQLEDLEFYYSRDKKISEWEKWSLKAEQSHYAAEELKKQGKKFEAFLKEIENFEYSSQAVFTNPGKVAVLAGVGIGFGVLNTVAPELAIPIAVTVGTPSFFINYPNMQTQFINNPARLTSEITSNIIITSTAGYFTSKTITDVQNLLTKKTVVYPTKKTEIKLYEKTSYDQGISWGKFAEPESTEYYLEFKGRVYRKTYIIPPELKSIHYTGSFKDTTIVPPKDSAYIISGKEENILFLNKVSLNTNIPDDALFAKNYLGSSGSIIEMKFGTPISQQPTIPNLQNIGMVADASYNFGSRNVDYAAAYSDLPKFSVTHRFIMDEGSVVDMFENVMDIPIEKMGVTTYREINFLTAEGERTQGVVDLKHLFKPAAESVSNMIQKPALVIKKMMVDKTAGFIIAPPERITEMQPETTSLIRGSPFIVIKPLLKEPVSVLELSPIPQTKLQTKQELMLDTKNLLDIEKSFREVAHIKNIEISTLQSEEQGRGLAEIISVSQDVGQDITPIHTQTSDDILISTPEDLKEIKPTGFIIPFEEIPPIPPPFSIPKFISETNSVIKRFEEKRKRKKYGEYVNPFATPSQFLTKNVLKLESKKYNVGRNIKKDYWNTNNYADWTKRMKKHIYNNIHKRLYYERKKQRLLIQGGVKIG